MFLITMAVILALAYGPVPSLIGRIIFRLNRRAYTEEKEICLTFDDGPSREYTEELLDLLKKYQVKAAFFVVAQAACENQDILDRMAQEGHTIGFHSEHHQSALFRSPRFLEADITRGLTALDGLGQHPRYYRPPWGHINWFTLYYAEKHSLKLMMWNVMIGDWKRSASPAVLEKKLLTRVRPGAIICLHDGRGAPGAPKRTIQTLEKVIPSLQEEGYRFVGPEEVYD